MLWNEVQGGPSGRGMQFVDIKLKVPPEYKFLILNAILIPMSTTTCPQPDGPPCSNQPNGSPCIVIDGLNLQCHLQSVYAPVGSWRPRLPPLPRPRSRSLECCCSAWFSATLTVSAAARACGAARRRWPRCWARPGPAGSGQPKQFFYQIKTKYAELLTIMIETRFLESTS